MRPLRMDGAGLNQPAIDFYEKMGATLLPDWRIVRVTGDALGHMAAPDQ